MIRHLLHRLIVSAVRLIAAGIALLVLLELSFCVFGGSDDHVWMPESYGPVPPELAPRPLDWLELMSERSVATGRVLLLAIPGILLVGYAWGILGARLRRFHAARLLAAPFAAFACVPGFWFVGLVAIYSYFHWQRPGFANDLVVERGPDLLTWWHASVVALPAMAAGIAWQIRAVSTVLEREAGSQWVRGLSVAGFDNEEIYYGNVLRRATPAFAALFDRNFPALLGGLAVLESAFRYPGMGALLVDSVKSGSYSGILLSSLAMTAFATLATLLRELVSPPLPNP